MSSRDFDFGAGNHALRAASSQEALWDPLTEDNSKNRKGKERHGSLKNQAAMLFGVFVSFSRCA